MVTRLNSSEFLILRSVRQTLIKYPQRAYEGPAHGEAEVCAGGVAEAAVVGLGYEIALRYGLSDRDAARVYSAVPRSRAVAVVYDYRSAVYRRHADVYDRSGEDRFDVGALCHVVVNAVVAGFCVRRLKRYVQTVTGLVVAALRRRFGLFAGAEKSCRRRRRKYGFLNVFFFQQILLGESGRYDGFGVRVRFAVVFYFAHGYVLLVYDAVVRQLKRVIARLRFV